MVYFGQGGRYIVDRGWVVYFGQWGIGTVWTRIDDCFGTLGNLEAGRKKNDKRRHQGRTKKGEKKWALSTKHY